MKSNLSDVAVLPPDRNLDLALDEVGLENVQTQVRVQGLTLPAKGFASVSLVDRKSRGIHMSRLFRILNQIHQQELSWTWLASGLEQMLASHEGLSDGGHLEVAFELPILRKALISSEQGWRNYPVAFRAESYKGRPQFKLKVRVLYSSTCPCSTGLSRQAIQDDFRKTFEGRDVNMQDMIEWLGRPEAYSALPHSQRSEAIVEFTIDPGLGAPAALTLIDEIEDALGTAVQAAVKREDEQEFARRNAQNLMFCEDAARKIKAALVKRTDLADFQIEVRHFESLHAHDVVAKVGKRD